VPRDTLKRHLATHGSAAAAEYEALSRGIRACVACAKAKQRCSGVHPCERCVVKGYECVLREPEATPHVPERLPGTDEYPPQPQSIVNPPGEASRPPPPHEASVDPQPTNAVSVPTSAWDPSLGFDWDAIAALDQPHSLPFAFHGFDPIESLMDYGQFYPFEAGATPRDPSLHPPRDAATHQSPPVALPAASPDQPRPSGPMNDMAKAIMGLNASHPMTDDEILESERFCHVPNLLQATYDKIVKFFHRERTRQPSSFPDIHFPDIRPMDVFLQLFFEHFHPMVPILHVPTFEPREDHWMLVLVLVTIGSRYSSVSRRLQYHQILDQLLYALIHQDVSLPSTGILLMQQDLLLTF
jgi:hypothetical protein